MNPDGNGESEFGSDDHPPYHENVDPGNAEAGMEFGELKERHLSNSANGSSVPTPEGPASAGHTSTGQPAYSGQPVHTGYYRPPRRSQATRAPRLSSRQATATNDDCRVVGECCLPDLYPRIGRFCLLHAESSLYGRNQNFARGGSV